MPRKLLLIFLLALTTRALFFSVSAVSGSGSFEDVFPRYDGYYEVAKNLLAGNGFSRSVASPIVPDSVRTPLYPLFLAALILLFKSYAAVALAQIALSSLTPLLGYRIAKQLLPHERIATVVAVVLALEPLSLHLATTLQAETLFTVLFLCGVTVFLDYWKTESGGALAGAFSLFALGALARPTIQFLPIFLIGAVFFLLRENPRGAARRILLGLAVFIGILSPWLIRNWAAFGNPVLSVQYASVPYGYLVPSVIALEKNIGFAEAQREFYEGEGAIKDVEDITLANAKEYKRRLPELLLAHPVGLMKSVGVTVFTFFTHDGYLDVLTRLHLDPALRLERPAFTLLFESPKEAVSLIVSLAKSPALLIILGRIFWTLVALCFIMGAIRLLKNPEHCAKGIFVLLLVAYFVFTTVAVGLAVNARFRIPVNALVLALAAYGASGFFIWIKSHTRRDEKCN